LGCIDCEIQRGYICTYKEELGFDDCLPDCGDGLLIGNEICDAGKLDGCKKGCDGVEEGYSCSGGSETEPS